MRKYEDSYQHKGLRKKLMDLLRGKGISDENVLKAMNNIPRHYFLDSAFDKIAYEDRAFPISEGQTISQPYTVAYQTQLLQIRPNDKILEIGTGSIYQATVLAEMGAKVFTIERQKNLFGQCVGRPTTAVSQNSTLRVLRRCSVQARSATTSASLMIARSLWMPILLILITSTRR